MKTPFQKTGSVEVLAERLDAVQRSLDHIEDFEREYRTEHSKLEGEVSALENQLTRIVSAREVAAKAYPFVVQVLIALGSLLIGALLGHFSVGHNL
jgi:hypothetical protein